MSKEHYDDYQLQQAHKHVDIVIIKYVLILDEDLRHFENPKQFEKS